MRTSLPPVLLALVTGVTACGSSESSGVPAEGGAPANTSTEYWAGDPCSLLRNEDFLALTPPMHVASSEAHNANSAKFPPDCRFYLQADGGSAAVGLFIDLAKDFQLQKTVFHGEPLTGFGKNAWRGNTGGIANSTVGVLLDAWSFRVDSTYEYEYDDLEILAASVEKRLK